MLSHRQSLCASFLLLFSCTLVRAYGAPMDDGLRGALSAPTRTAASTARDHARHPVEELSFFGLTPKAHVAELWPDGGYWTEILAPYLRDHGHYILALGDPEGSPVERAYSRPPPAWVNSRTPAPSPYDRVIFGELAQGRVQLGPPDSLDVVLTFRNLHNWMNQGDVRELLAGIHRALKPGGVFGVEDHRARPVAPQDPRARSGYVRQDYAVDLIQSAGFRLVGTSEINANPKDTTDWPQGVWTLPPTLALGAQNRDRYQAIGEADNFVLKFVKIDD